MYVCVSVRLSVCLCICHEISVVASGIFTLCFFFYRYLCLKHFKIKCTINKSNTDIDSCLNERNDELHLNFFLLPMIDRQID